jgi:hypothetical protein
VSDSHAANAFIQWAQREPSISVLNLIGSQVRSRHQEGAADVHSDWDFQLVVRQPKLFANSDWIGRAGLPPPLAYVVRPGRLGSSGKVSVAFADVALDLVLIPAVPFRLARALCALGLVNTSNRARTGMADLAVVLRGGYQLLKGEAAWARFFEYVRTQVAPVRINDQEVAALAEGFVCDYLSTRHKIARGEFAAAQRWLHGHLAETNFRLLHELRQRAGEASFPDARRLELLASDPWVASVTVRALPDRESLEAATEKCAQTLCDLVRALAGEKWNWPSQVPLRLRGK